MVRSRYCLWALLLLSSSALAQYRCVENGKTVFTDRPCPSDSPSPAQSNQGSQPKIIGDAANSAYGTPSGTWRGQVQYQGTASGGVVHEAMAVVPMTIDIDPQGKVKGSSPENGCNLKGIAAPGILPVSVSLDVTFTGCHYKGLNRRFSGSLYVNQAQKHARLSLNGSHVVVLGGVTFFDVKGTLRR